MLTNEKRSSPRKPVALQASVTQEFASWPDQELSAETRNLSRTGALIELHERLMPGEVCTMTVAKLGGGYGDIPSRIVWVDREPNGLYRAGVAFRNLTADQEYVVDLHLLRSTC